MDRASISPRLSRRQFLKASAAMTALAAFHDKLLPGGSGWIPAESAAPQQDEWLHSYCRMCQRPHCATQVRVRNGVVVGIEGDAASPINEGTLCPRGNSAIMNLYNPYRVKTPLKRTNPAKGLDIDPHWVEISWDEAMTTVADRLQKIKAEDPRKLVINTGFGSASDYYSAVLSSFSGAFGMPSPNQVSSNGPLCSVHLASSMAQAAFTNSPDLVYCNYLITLGCSVGANWGIAAGPLRGLLSEAIDRGMKMVVVDPRAGKEAALGEWVPIRPGGELAFELGMINAMLYEIGLAKLDVAFLKRRTNAPYLVGAGERYVRDTATKKPMIWDPTDNKAKVFDDATIKDYALEGEFQVNGQAVRTGFAAIKAEVKSNTPEWAETISTIPASTIRRIANEFVTAAQIGSTITLDGIEFPLRTAMIKPKRGGLSQSDGGYVMFASKIINELVGAMDVPGGDLGVAWGPVLKPNEDGVVTPIGEAVGLPFNFPPEDVQLSSFFPHRHYTPFVAWRAILDPKKYFLPYNVEALIVYGANAIINNAAPDEPIAAFKKIPFVASIAYHIDEPAMFADIVLPEPSNLEREMRVSLDTNDSNGTWTAAQPRAMMYRYPVISPLYSTKQADEIFLDLGNRLKLTDPKSGMIARLSTSLALKPEYALSPDKTYTISDIIDRDFKSRYGADKGTAYFKTVGFRFETVGPKTSYNYAYFPMGKTRHPIFFEHLKEVGDRLKAGCEKQGISVPGWDMADLLDHYRPIPHWRAMPIHNQSPEYDLYFTNWKTPFVLFGLGGNAENPWFYEISKETDPYLRMISMNPATAAKKGLKEGDMVEVSSQWGKVTGRLKLSSLFHSEVIGTPGNFGRRSMFMNPISREGINYNQLISADDGWFDPVTAGLVISPRVKVRKV